MQISRPATGPFLAAILVPLFFALSFLGGGCKSKPGVPVDDPREFVYDAPAKADLHSWIEPYAIDDRSFMDEIIEKQLKNRQWNGKLPNDSRELRRFVNQLVPDYSRAHSNTETGQRQVLEKVRQRNANPPIEVVFSNATMEAVAIDLWQLPGTWGEGPRRQVRMLVDESLIDGKDLSPREFARALALGRAKFPDAEIYEIRFQFYSTGRSGLVKGWYRYSPKSGFLTRNIGGKEHTTVESPDDFANGKIAISSMKFFVPREGDGTPFHFSTKPGPL